MRADAQRHLRLLEAIPERRERALIEDRLGDVEEDVVFFVNVLGQELDVLASRSDNTATGLRGFNSVCLNGSVQFCNESPPR